MNIFWNEYQRYKKLLDETLQQISDDDLFRSLDTEGNSIAVLLNHISGNFISRFTDFLTSDGEKDWRDRDSEFQAEGCSRDDLIAKWNESWKILEQTVTNLKPEDMDRIITIRGIELSVDEALARSLAHFSYHVGQIILLAKHFKGQSWKYLSIPPGKSTEYNQQIRRLNH